MDVLVNSAKSVLGEKLINNALSGFQLSPIALIIEDEWGYLEHSEGNFENLTSGAPVCGDLFADQLAGNMGDLYGRNQLDVWKLGQIGGNLISLSVLWGAVILPLLEEGVKYTATMFINV